MADEAGSLKAACARPMAAALASPGPGRGPAAPPPAGPPPGPPLALRGRGGRAGGALPVVCAVLCVCLALLEAAHLRQTALLRGQVLSLQQRMAMMETSLPRQLLVPVGYHRRRRSVAGGPRQKTAAGIPIVDRPYGYRPGLHENADGMRVYDSFGTSTEKPNGRSSILPHHRSSAAYHGAKLGRVNTKSAAKTPPPQAMTQRTSDVNHRRSRVQQTDKKTKGKDRRGRRRRVTRKRLAGKRVKNRKAAEARGAPTGYSPKPLGSGSGLARSAAAPGAAVGRGSSAGHGGGRPSGGGGRPSGGSSGGSRRMRRMMRMVEELRESVGSTAAHLEGHTTNYSLDHPHYGGNGLLRNSQPDAMFTDWEFAPWMQRHGFSRDFKLHGGMVTVTKPGIYLLYAQVNYLDDSDINGFEIVVSGRPFAKCLTMEASDHQQKANTCHTSGVTFLERGDSVSVRDLERMRVSMFLPDRSFFGLVRLAGGGGDAGDRRHSRRDGGWTI